MGYILVLYILFGVGVCVTYVRGQTLTFQGSSFTAFLGDSVELSCSVTDVTSLQGLVYFKRGSANLCTVNTAECSQFSNTFGYSCDCVSGGSSMERTFNLNITSVSLQDDSDNWRCQYSGLNSGSVGVDVYYTPEISSLPIRQNVKEHTSPNIDCSSYTTAGNPSLTSYSWTGPDDYNKTGPVLDRILSRSDDGYYNCTATNTVGLSDTSFVIINVQYGPKITSVDTSINLTEETSPDIDCSSNITFGNPTSTSYRWTGPGGYSNTGPVLDRHFTRAQGGQYTCTATNTAGLQDIAQVYINVQYAPNISLPATTEVTENISPNLDCSMNVNPGKPVETIYGWTGPDGYNETGAVLDRNITRDQSGIYTCTATNVAGLSDSTSVVINVQYAPRLQITRIKDVTENTSPYIDCSVSITPGNPVDVGYAWTGPDGYYRTGAVLDRNITRTQGGRYICTATNTVGLSDTAEVNINVIFLDAPALNVSSHLVMENDSVQVVCDVASHPTVQMTIRNVDNKTNIVEQEPTNTLQYNIERVQCLHNGTFKCVADNKELPRMETDSTDISVLCSPRHDYRQPLKQIFFRAISAAATMTVDVIANPLPTFTWWRYVDGQLEPISDYTVHTIQITDLQSTLQVTVTHVRDYGTYAVKMENEFGENILLYTLSPVTVPLAPDEVSVVNISSSALVLQWKSNINGGSEQTFSVDYRTEDSDWVSWRSGISDPGRGVLVSVKVTGLKQNTKYLLQVYATNIYGSSIKVVKEGSTTNEIAEAIEKSGVDQLYIGLGVGLGLLIVIGVCVVLVCVCRRKKTRSADSTGCAQANPSMKAKEKDKSDNSSVRTERYEGTSVRVSHVYDSQHYIEMTNEEIESPESAKPTQSTHVEEKDKPKGYDGTSVRDPHVDDDQYVDLRIEQIDAAKDVANRTEETQDQHIENCYSNQPEYLNFSGKSKDEESRNTDVKFTDTKSVAGEYMNVTVEDTDLYEPVETGKQLQRRDQL